VVGNSERHLEGSNHSMVTWTNQKPAEGSCRTQGRQFKERFANDRSVNGALRAQKRGREFSFKGGKGREALFQKGNTSRKSRKGSKVLALDKKRPSLKGEIRRVGGGERFKKGGPHGGSPGLGVVISGAGGTVFKREDGSDERWVIRAAQTRETKSTWEQN